MPDKAQICGVLLAGGQSRRMGGGDKALRDLTGRPVLSWIIEAATPQVSDLIINANGAAGPYEEFGLPVVPDLVPNHAGPLAGILTGLAWVRENRPHCKWIASFACDAPFIPGDLVSRLAAAVEEVGADLACAQSGDRHHPVFGLWPVSLADALDLAVREQGVRKVDQWTASYRLAVASWDAGDVDPFFNVNRPEDLEAAAEIAAEGRVGDAR